MSTRIEINIFSNYKRWVQIVHGLKKNNWIISYNNWLNPLYPSVTNSSRIAKVSILK